MLILTSTTRKLYLKLQVHPSTTAIKTTSSPFVNTSRTHFQIKVAPAQIWLKLPPWRWTCRSIWKPVKWRIYLNLNFPISLNVRTVPLLTQQLHDSRATHLLTVETAHIVPAFSLLPSWRKTAPMLIRFLKMTTKRKCTAKWPLMSRMLMTQHPLTLSK